MEQKLYKPVIKKLEVNDEHYYFVDGEFYPSVTKILGETMPMPYALRQWIGDVGNEKAESKMNRAAARGTLIHNGCEALLRGEKIKLTEIFPNRKDQALLVAFKNWAAEYQPQVESEHHIEMTVASVYKYAGTLDIFCTIKGEPWIIDIKTSAGVYDSHMLQVAAYRNAFHEMTGIWAKMGILHLKSTTKKGYQFVTDIEIKGKPISTDDFMKVYDLCLVLNGGKIPEPALQEEYPEYLSLAD